MTADEMARKYLKRNFTLNAIDGISFFTGMIFLSPDSVLPVFLDKLGASAFLISLIPVMRNLGVFFPSIFVAQRLQRLKRKKAWIIQMGLLQRVPWLFAGLFCLMYAADHPLAAVMVVLSALFITSVGAGLNIPAFTYFTAKTIPVEIRGKLFAIRNLVSYFIGLVCGGLIAWILSRFPLPVNFSILILIGFGVLMLYLPALALIMEPDAKKQPPKTLKSGEFARNLVSILKSDRDLVNYIVGRIFFTIAFASYSYFAVYLVRRYSLPESEAGVFTLIIAATFIIANPILGLISDRRGHLFNHFLGSGALIVANLIAILALNYRLALASVALGAFVQCVLNVSCFTIPMEFGEDHEIPVYVGLVGLFVGATALLIIPFGLVADTFGFKPLFWICLASAAFSMFFFARTKEPRRRKAFIGDA